MRLTPVRFAQTTSQRAELVEWLRSQKVYRREEIRSHVVNPGLCDEALKILGPTLPKPHTCDIIDINPGAGVWSKALHDLVQPRRHILVEPGIQRYGKYLRPLLEQTNSAYRLADELKDVLDEDNQLLSPEVKALADQKKAEQARGIRHNTFHNHTLLVTANLTAQTGAIAGFRGTIAKRFFNAWYRSLQDNEKFIHKYGLVRLLAWVDDGARRTLVPTTVAKQVKQTLQIDAAFDISEVVSPNNYIPVRERLGHKRWFELDRENMESVEKAQKEAGIVVPESRQPKRAPAPIGYYEPKAEVYAKNRDDLIFNKTFVDRYVALHNFVEDKDPAFIHELRYGATARLTGVRVKTDRILWNIDHKTQSAYRLLMTQALTYRTRYLRDQEFIQSHRRLWWKLREATQADPPDAELVKTLRAEYAALELAVRKVGTKDDHKLIGKARDDYRAYDSRPQTLAFNRRSFEPLLSLAKDFEPAQPLTLLDVTPRASFQEQLDTFDKRVCFDHVVMTMMMHPGSSFAKVVKRLIPAGHEEFIESIPDLKDVTQGGWHELEQLNIRALSRDMIIKIALAFEKWPFRPELMEMLNVRRRFLDAPPVNPEK